MTRSSTVPVVFVSNGLMLPGLHVALASFIRSHRDRPDEFEIHIFTLNVSDGEKRELAMTAEHIGGTELAFHELDISCYMGLKPLQGDYTTYARLGLPRLFPEVERILYLDADILILESLHELSTWPLGNKPFAASAVGTVGWALERDFFINVLGLSENARSFNAGVLLINADYWCREDLGNRCIDFGLRQRKYLLAADQTILNALFSAEFAELPDRFNRIVTPAMQPPSEAAIIHFVGSPKPWDPLARHVHRSASLWSTQIAMIPFNPLRCGVRHFMEIVWRMWTIRRSYLRQVWGFARR